MELKKPINTLRHMSGVLKDRIHWASLLTASSYERLELARIKRIPRYQRGTTDFLGRPVAFVDSATFLHGYKEIFQKEVYRFRASTQMPVIIDCGANIVFCPQAVWIQDKQMDFSVEGGFSGRLAKPGDHNELISVPTCRLRNSLEDRIDFLKIDIEGAEHQVLMDCADLLHNVENIFIEYHSHFKEQQQ